ncbi:MAG: hypothetical protein ACJ0G4_06520, partial [Alphaproteobacteria bacterium]
MDSNPIDKIKINLNDSIQSKKINSIGDQTKLEDVAQEFESLFVYQILKSARQAKLSENLFSNQGSETY